MAPKQSICACVFCLNSHYKNPSISLHLFPRNQFRRSLWLIACGLTEEDDKPSIKLCSQHFDQNCFKKKTTINILKPNSVPTKFNKHGKLFTYTCSYEIPEMFSCAVTKLMTCEIDRLAVSTVKYETVSNCEIGTSQIDTPKQKPHKYYVGDFTTPDKATPKRAKQNCTKAEYKIIENQNKINYLNLKVSRLHNRLISMAEILNNLKKKNLLTEKAYDAILVNLIKMDMDVKWMF